VADKALMDPAAPRSGRVTVTLKDGRTVSHFTRHAPGTPENPMATEQVNAKARALMAPVLGARNAEAVIQRVNDLEALQDVRALRPYLARAAGGARTAKRKPAVKKAVKLARNKAGQRQTAKKKSAKKKAVKKK
jgi:hypothetical protein